MRRRPRIHSRRDDERLLTGVGQPHTAEPFVKDSLALGSGGASSPKDVPILLFDAGLLVLLACAVTVALPPFHEPIPPLLRVAIVVLAASFVPGAAVLTRVRVAVPATQIALAVALSLALDSLASVALAWSGWWHPNVLAVAVAAGSGVLLTVDAKQRLARARLASRHKYERSLGSRRSYGGPAAAVMQVIPAVAALALWAVSLGQIDITHLGDYGLTPELPALWFAALAIAVLGTCAVLQTRAPRAIGIVAGVAAIAVILFGTIPALSEYPQYAWTYKHLGVTRFIESHGGVDASVDIYNRWPGFFAPAAVLASIAGLPDPITYAGWSEVFFTWVDALLIAAAVWSVSRSKRVAGGAATLFVVVNWVGQDYYSPQAFAFALMLGCTVLLTSALASREQQAAWRTLGAVLAVTRSKPPRVSAPSASAPRYPAVTLFLIIYASIVASHQLSPYALIAQVALLAALSLTRPRWLVAVMILMAIGYLVPNLLFVRDHFGFLSTFDPLGRALESTAPASDPVAGKAFNVHAALLLTALLGIGGILSYVRLARCQLSRRALPLLVLALAPFAILLGGQGFGGEASLRAILFSSPWCAALISWSVTTMPRRGHRLVVFSATTCAFTTLFLPSFYGQTELNIIPSGEVRAAEYLHAHAAPGAVIMVSGIEFPTLSSNIVGSGSNNAECLNCLPEFAGRMLGESDIPAIVTTLKKYAPRGYLVFSTSEEMHERVFRTAPVGSLRSLERAISKSSDFRLWHVDDDARIYEFGSGVQAVPEPIRAIPGGRVNARIAPRGGKARKLAPIKRSHRRVTAPRPHQSTRTRYATPTRTAPPPPPPPPPPAPRRKPTPRPKPIKVVILPPSPPVDVEPSDPPPTDTDTPPTTTTDPSAPASTEDMGSSN